MRIEVQFRDTKNLALGMGLSQSRSQGQQRLQALLLIAHIAELAKRLIGEASQARQLELRLMSNNITKRKTIIGDDARRARHREGRLVTRNYRCVVILANLAKTGDIGGYSSDGWGVIRGETSGADPIELYKFDQGAGARRKGAEKPRSVRKKI